MKLNKSLKLFIGLLLLAIVSIIGPYLLLNMPFEYGGDLKPSWYAFYTEMQNLISLRAIVQHGRLPFYSWNMFLGTNFWASKGFYGLADIFNYVTLWFPIHFYVVFEIQIVIKVLFAGISFFYFLGKYTENTKAQIIGALSYALSSWFIFFIGQLSFASFYAILPFYFWGVESYLQDRKKLMFIISTVFLLFTNYYLFYSLSLFTVIYYLYRYYLIHKGFKEVVKNTLWIIFFYFVGAMITGVITIPTVLYMLGSDRVGGFGFNFKFYTLEIYLHQLVAMLVPTHVYIYDGNAFETGLHTTRELLLWGSSISTLLVPQFLSDQDKSYKKATSIVYIILALILLNPIGGSIMHGFSETSFRWTFLLIIFNITVSIRYLSDFSKINLSTLKKTLWIYSALLLLTLPINIYFNGEISSWLSSYWTITLFYAMSLLTYLVLYLLITKNIQKVFRWLILLTFIELTAYSSYNLVYNRMNPAYTWDFTIRATSVLQTYPNELNNFINGLDYENASAYYRVFIPHESLYWSYSHNMNIHYQLQGLMTYDSTYAPSFNDLKSIAPQVKDFESNWIFNIKDPNLIDFLNVKYAVVVDESELPHPDFTLITDTYRGSLKVYENNRYRSLGNTYTNIMTYKMLDVNYNNNTKYLNTSLVVHDEDFEEIKAYLKSSTRSSLVNISHFDNMLMGTIESDESSFMVINLPYDEGWKITINGEEVKKYQVNGGFIGIPIEKGINNLQMNFMPAGFKLGFGITAVGVLGLLIIFIQEKRKQR